MHDFAQKFTSRLHPSWIFYTLIFGSLAGFVICQFFNFVPFAGAIWLTSALLLFVLSLIFSRVFCILFAVCAGFILASCRFSPLLAAKSTFSALEGEILVIAGTVSEDPETSPSGATIRLKNLQIQFPRGKPVENSANSVENSVKKPVENFQISGTLYVKLARAPDGLECSDRLTLEGKLSAGFGTFVGSLYRPEILAFEKPAFPDIFARFKTSFAAKVRASLDDSTANLGLSYLLGLKSGLSDDFSEQLRTVGMSHVVVASGAHLAILVAASRRLFGKVSKFAGTMFASLAILAFAAMVGFTPSMTRAALVALLSLLTGYVGRKFTPLRLLSFVASLTLFIEPTNLLNLGWQLSFASFFGILILTPRLTKFFYGEKTPPWLANMLFASLATTLTCAPILIYNFGTISLLSVIANLIILPTLPYAMLLTFLTGINSLFGKLASLLLGLHIWVINFLSDKTIFVLELSSGNPLIFLFYFPILIICAIIKP